MPPPPPQPDLARLALLGLGTLATGAFGVLSLTAGYHLKKRTAPKPEEVTPLSYLDDLVHMVPPWMHKQEEGEAAASSSASASSASKMPTLSSSPGLFLPLSDEEEVEAQRRRAEALQQLEEWNRLEEEELTWHFRPERFEHVHTATPSFPLPPSLLAHVSTFLPYESLCVLQSVSKTLQQFSSQLLSDRSFVFTLARSRQGFSEHFRGRIWMDVTKASQLARYMQRRASSSVHFNFYESLLTRAREYREAIVRQNKQGGRSPRPDGDASSSSSSASSSPPSFEIEGLPEETRSALETIMKDVPRTFVPANPQSSSIISNSSAAASAAKREQRMQSLLNLLSVYALHDQELSYTQAMNFVASHLLEKLQEQDAYWLFYQLMQDPTWKLRNFYLPGLEGLHVCRYQFQYLFQLYLPELYLHFRTQDVHLDVFTEWFLTLFTFSSFPRRYPLLDRFWDLMISSGGLKFLHRVGLSILYLAQDTLMEYEFEDIIFFLKQLPDEGILNPDLLLPIACDRFKVSNRALRELEKQYHEEQAKEGWE